MVRLMFIQSRVFALIMSAVFVLGALAFLALVKASPAAAAEIHAHRGGARVEGVPTFPENSMSAFQHSLEQGWVIEFDLQRTSDGVAIAMHDGKLDRTTNCDGWVKDFTWDEIEANCRLDVLGIGSKSAGYREDLDPGDPRLEPVPSLAQILDLLESTGGKANIEVKSDSGPELAQEVYDQIAASGVNERNLIIQNFSSIALQPVAATLPKVGIALLGAVDNETHFTLAEQVGAHWSSLSWDGLTDPADYVTRSHDRGLRVVPWTFDEEADLVAAGEAGVDGVITNDPTMADRLIGSTLEWWEEEDQVEPEAATTLRWQLKAPRLKVKRGKVATLRVRVRNAGEVASGRVRLNIKVPKGKARLVGKANRVIAKVPAGATRVVKLKVRVKPKVRPRTAVRVVTQLKAVRKADSVKPVARRAVRLRVVR